MTNKTPYIFNEGNLKTASDLELLKVLSGDDTATKMLHNECCDLYRTLMLPVCELKALGLKESTATRIKAGIELSRRIFAKRPKPLKQFNTSIETALYLLDSMRYLSSEEFVVLSFNVNNELIAKKILGTGSTNSAVAKIREIYKAAILFNADHIIIAHNHTHGNPEPSKQDNEFTKMVTTAGQIMGISCYDHIIIGNGSYYSYLEKSKKEGDRLSNGKT